MIKYRVYDDAGREWCDVVAETEAEAVQIAANRHGTIDVGQTQASTDGLHARPIKSAQD